MKWKRIGGERERGKMPHLKHLRGLKLRSKAAPPSESALHLIHPFSILHHLHVCNSSTGSVNNNDNRDFHLLWPRVLDVGPMADVAPCGCHAANFDSCSSLLSSVHTLLVNILRCVRLYIKRKYYYIIIRQGSVVTWLDQLSHE